MICIFFVICRFTLRSVYFTVVIYSFLFPFEVQEYMESPYMQSAIALIFTKLLIKLYKECWIAKRFSECLFCKVGCKERIKSEGTNHCLSVKAITRSMSIILFYFSTSLIFGEKIQVYPYITNHFLRNKNKVTRRKKEMIK